MTTEHDAEVHHHHHHTEQLSVVVKKTSSSDHEHDDTEIDQATLEAIAEKHVGRPGAKHVHHHHFHRRKQHSHPEHAA